MTSPTSSPNTLPVVHADSDGSAAARVVQTVKSAVRVQESEIKRWRRTFDANAKAAVNGDRCVLSFVLPVQTASERAWPLGGGWHCCRFLDREQFVNAIAPKGDLTRIGRAQFATLFRVADAAKRGLLSWDDFVVFQTLLKRPDADYYIAFQYFDVYARMFPLCVHGWDG
jgi:solute carrier family 25 aspartate/glutamate transporter 12/13